MSGNASAPHDHYEHLVNGRQQDPLCYLRDYQQIRRWLTKQRYGLFYPASESIDVLTAQWRLNLHGHFVVADGVYGTHSQTHMRAFQTSKGLQPDGIVGRLTWQALLKRPEL
jgi:peptidoglycan hydrolase-like protein with peptidoglycan-binding domain